MTDRGSSISSTSNLTFSAETSHLALSIATTTSTPRSGCLLRKLAENSGHQALDIIMSSLTSEIRCKFANLHGTGALPFVLAVDDPLANTFLFPDGAKDVKILQLISSRFIDLIVRLILSTRVRLSADRRFWFLENTGGCIPFRIVSAGSKKVDLRSLARSRRNSIKCIKSNPSPFSGFSRVLAFARSTFAASGVRERL
jgi:hypothetical protein